MDANLLADAWEAGSVFPDGISHRDHVRIAWVLYQRHDVQTARERLVTGTKRACRVHGCPEKFDAALTLGWARAIEASASRAGWSTSADAFIEAHPELLDSALVVRSQ